MADLQATLTDIAKAIVGSPDAVKVTVEPAEVVSEYSPTLTSNVTFSCVPGSGSPSGKVTSALTLSTPSP